MLKGDKFESLEGDDKEILKAYGRELSLDFLENRTEPIQEIEGEFKKIAGIIYILYLKGSVDCSFALGGAEGCLEIYSLPQTFKFLSAIVRKEDQLNEAVIFGFFLNLARIHPIEFTKFTIENAPVIQKKMKSFNQVVDSVFFQLDERRGCKELSDLFVELLDKMGLENLKTFYKNEAFQNAILGNKNYETLVSKMKEVWGMSSIDFIPMDRIDASCLTYLDTQPDFRKRFEEDPVFAKEMGLIACSLGLNEMAITATSELACKNPEASLEVLQKYLDGKELSKPAFFLSLTILGKIKEHTPSLINKEQFRSLIQQRLGVLALFLSGSSSYAFEELDDESLEKIRYFHALVVFDTIEHPSWYILWHYLRERQLPVGNWINSKDIGEKLSQIDPKGNIIPFLQTFTLDSLFLVEFVRGMKGISPSEIDKYKSLLFFTFKMGKNSLLINQPKIDSSTYEPAEFLFELLNSFYTTTEVCSEDLIAFDMALLSLKFSALFGDKSLRAKAMLTIRSLIENTGPFLRGYIKNSVHPKSVFLSCLDRALEEKNLEELHGLTEVHNTWRSDQTLAGRIIFGKSKIVSVRCEALLKYLAELFRDPLQNERMTAESSEFKLLGFYTVYLDELIIAQTVLETTASVRAELDVNGGNSSINHEVVFKHFLDLLDFLTRKKLVPPLQISVQILACIQRQMNGERISEVSSKYLVMVTELIAQAIKKPISFETRASLSFLFASISVLQTQGEQKGKVLFSSSQVIPFLKVARSALSEISSTREQFLLYLDQLPILESTLNKKDAEFHLSDWSASILARRETVTFEELNLFALYTCRLDARLYHSEDMLTLLPRFKDKLLVNQKYFNSFSVIRSYIEIIDIALSRYSHKFFDGSLMPSQFTVFSLLSFYNEFILNGIIDQRNIAHKETLQVSLILTVAKCLRLPGITQLSNPAMKCLLNSLIGKKALGVFELLKFSKDKLPIATELEIFHLMVRQLFRFSNEDLETENAYFIILKYTYENGIAYRNKAFSKDQIAEIESILRSPEELTAAIEEALKEVIEAQ